MRIHTRDGNSGFLGYCANVHAGETLDDVLRAVSHFGAGVRRELTAPALSLGLWLSQRSVSELIAEPGRLQALQRALAEAGVIVVTLNGFPYGNFHARVVKRAVYHPDLGSSQRREYLRDLAIVLCQLLPDDALEGTISTLPIGHRDEAADHGETSDAAAAAALQLSILCKELAALRERTGKSIRICLEPEPGCYLESTEDALRFFSDVLPRVARNAGVPQALIDQHLGLCYDTCHQAICFEDARDSITRITQAGIRIGKMQLSSALQIERPADPTQRAELLRFAEPRFLHQVRTHDRAGQLCGVDDLDHIATLPMDNAWRVHFHVPIHRAHFGPIATTRAFLVEVLQTLLALPPSAAPLPLPHLEVETYTWNVLPEAERPADDAGLMAGLAQEISFVRAELVHQHIVRKEPA